MITQKEAIANVNSKGYSTFVKVTEEIVKVTQKILQNWLSFQESAMETSMQFFFLQFERHIL